MPSQLLSSKKRQHIIESLLAGRLVVFPTDTVYGVGALALDENAVRTMYALKRRPRHMATPVMVATADKIMEIAEPLPGFWDLAERFWPGPLSLILPKTAVLPGVVTANGRTVALRIPDHPFALDLLQAIARPLAVTSANLTGRPPACTAKDARTQLGDFPIILDGGESPGGEPSTILDLTTEIPRVLRPGPIAAGDIAKTLNRAVELNL